MTYWRQRPRQALGSVDPHTTVVASNTDAVVDEPVRILTWQPEAINGIRKFCERELANQCYAAPFYNPDGTIHSLGVFALKANKGTALEVVLDRLDIQPAQVMALGDNVNDLPMFDRAGVSVAMANAPDEVKQAASSVAPSNEDEGVAWALKAYNVV